MRFVLGDPYLRVFTVFGSVSNLAMNGFTAIMVIFLVREVGVSSGTVGVIVAVISVGGVLGAIAAGRVIRRFGTGHGLLVCLLGSIPFALLIPLTAPGPRLGFMVLGGLIVTAGVVTGNIIRSSFRQTYCPRHLQGRVTVTMQFLNYGAIPIGALLAGALATAIGVRETVWITIGTTALSALILLIGPIRKNRDLPDRPSS